MRAWLVLGMQLLATDPAPPRPDAVQRRANMLQSLVARGDDVAIAYVVREVERGGVPPRALQAFLDAVREHPHPAYVGVLRTLTAYRNPAIRQRAFLAMAATDDALATEAALLAMNDTELRLRLLGLYLVHLHTNPRLEEAAILLLDRDRELAAIYAAHGRPRDAPDPPRAP